MRKPLIVAAALAVSGLTAIGTSVAVATAEEAPLGAGSTSYEAEASTNTLTGSARVADCRGCSGGKKVSRVGRAGALQINDVRVDAGGPTTVTITYASAQRRAAYLTVNDQASVVVNFPASRGYAKPRSQAITVNLRAGSNTLRFTNPRGWAPDFDKISIGSSPDPSPTATAAPTVSPTVSPTPVPTTSPTAPPGSSRVEAAEVLRLVNVERAAANCAPVTADSRLDAAAQGHSADMAERGYFSHTTPDGVDFATRITRAGYTWSGAGENIAKGQRTPADVMTAWMNSSGHRANILNCRFQHLGVGLAYEGKTPIWTQNFASPR
jgi:uncharacterized protein YkwD